MEERSARLVLLVTVIVYNLLSSVDASVHRFRSIYNPHVHHDLPSGYSYKTMYVTQNVDHFGFQNQQSFQQCFLVADQFWNDDGGPILFYTGGEGDITWFCNNTGFMWDSAPEFKALLVFAEHRYYGNSLPYGAHSYDNASMLNYLTVEQAMADFATLMHFVRGTIPGATHSQIITVGGAYAGVTRGIYSPPNFTPE